MAIERKPIKVSTHYQTLQIEPDAHTEVIDASFRQLAKRYHPDYNPTNAAMGKMQDLNAAYSVLRNRECRSVYNASLAEQAAYSSSRVSDRAKNSAFFICLLILAGLLFQFFNPSARTIAISNELPIVKSVDSDENLSDIQTSADIVADDVTSSLYLPKPNLSTSGTQQETAQVNSAKVEPPQNVFPNATVSTHDDVGTVRTVYDILHADSAIDSASHSTTDSTIVGSASAGPIVATSVPSAKNKPNLLQVAAAANDSTIVTEQNQAAVQIAATSTPVSTPRPTQPPAQSISVPKIAPTAAPIVQAAIQPAIEPKPIMIQQASISSVSSVPSVPSTQRGQAGAVRLIAPDDGINGRKLQTFQWSADFVPAPNQRFELIFWQPEQDPLASGFGLAALTNETSITVNLDELDVTLGTVLDWGHYRWGVLLVEQEPYRRIALLGSDGSPQSRAFLFTNYKSAERLVEQQSASAQGSP